MDSLWTFCLDWTTFAFSEIPISSGPCCKYSHDCRLLFLTLKHQLKLTFHLIYVSSVRKPGSVLRATIEEKIFRGYPLSRWTSQNSVEDTYRFDRRTAFANRIHIATITFSTLACWQQRTIGLYGGIPNYVVEVCVNLSYGNFERSWIIIRLWVENVTVHTDEDLEAMLQALNLNQTIGSKMSISEFEGEFDRLGVLLEKYQNDALAFGSFGVPWTVLHRSSDSNSDRNKASGLSGEHFNAVT